MNDHLHNFVVHKGYYRGRDLHRCLCYNTICIFLWSAKAPLKTSKTCKVKMSLGKNTQNVYSLRTPALTETVSNS